MIPHPHVRLANLDDARHDRTTVTRRGSIVEVELAAFTHGRHMDERRAAASSPKCERASGGSSARRCASRASASTPAPSASAASSPSTARRSSTCRPATGALIIAILVWLFAL
ncbi:hypothetical protein SETIT_7G228600v2 [Setaria italica]|uniref:Uncharacterized protein n=1 Tax=Setaria italica TaxID=4555 RepID=A0A368RYQ5_SETIT|nr:hypothetical protein SETIT_7G228600v2 [Setaria italica]